MENGVLEYMRFRISIIRFSIIVNESLSLSRYIYIHIYIYIYTKYLIVVVVETLRACLPMLSKTIFEKKI